MIAMLLLCFGFQANSQENNSSQKTAMNGMFNVNADDSTEFTRRSVNIQTVKNDGLQDSVAFEVSEETQTIVFHSKDGIETATVSLENSGIDVDLTLTLTQEPTKQNPDKDDEVLVIVDVHPKYPGGDEARLLFIRENIKYPKEAKDKGIQGTVYVNFIVEKDGSISNVNVARGVNKLLDDEAVRVTKLMPKWTPGKQKGEVVRVSFNMPIRFTLSDDEDKE